MLARISSASLVQRSRTQIARLGVLSNCHLGNQIAEHIGGSGRGYLAVGGPLSSPGMAYWMVACSVYLYIAILGANVRFCRKWCVHGGEQQPSSCPADQSAGEMLMISISRTPICATSSAFRLMIDRTVSAATDGSWASHSIMTTASFSMSHRVVGGLR